MNIYEKNTDLILENAEDFDLKQIFDCGQCFRWDSHGEGYLGIAYGLPLYVTQHDKTITLHNTTLADWNSVWKNYFDADRNYGKIKRTLSADPVMKNAISFGEGIRILNQEPFECLISFIISASNNIPRIKKIIDTLCKSFGEKTEYMGNCFYTFPSPERIASLDISDLSVIRAGFRDKYILAAAKCVSCGMIDLECLKNSSAEYAKSQLLKLPGVGNKVADCVLLFSLGKYSSFPIDVWIKRIMEYCYTGSEQPRDAIAALADKKFGVLGGFAQQYLFYWARENKIGI